MSRELVRHRRAEGRRQRRIQLRTGGEIPRRQRPRREDGEIILRRRVSAEGKSSAAVNGQSVTAAELRCLGALLLDIHGQNDGRALLDEANHRAYLDAFAQLDGELAAYGVKYEAWRASRAALRKLDMNERERESRMADLEPHDSPSSPARS